MGTARRAYDLMRGYVNREWDRISGSELGPAQRELDEAMASPNLPSTPPAEPIAAVTLQDRARSILGLNDSASFAEIRKAFERLNKRSDPKKLPSRFSRGDKGGRDPKANSLGPTEP